MLRDRPVWTRGLRLYHHPSTDADRAGTDAIDERDDALDARVHARSRFRSVVDPRRAAVYTVRDAAEPVWARLIGAPGSRADEHTLVVVREFRRVPLQASALALMLFTASAGRAAPVLAALAHFVERAVSTYQPAYLLLAHSLEHPRISALLMGVHECAALQAGSPSAFSLETLLPELRPLLAAEPEWYTYCPEPEAELVPHLVSPYAV